MSKYHYNKDYFEKIESPNQAYWLGFLYADGCINQYYKNEKLKRMNVEITLKESDRFHLEKFNQCLESNIPIHDKTIRFDGKAYKSCRLIICCTKMCYDLIRLGCTPRKTYDIKFPDTSLVPGEYMRDFIRGYFDGDGCIYTNNPNNPRHIELSITGMSDMLRSISDFLIYKKVLRVYPKIYKDKRSKACSVYYYGEDSIKEILDYLYADAEMYLDRKYNKYIDFYKDYDYNTKKRGVYYHEGNKAYIVTICINGTRIRVGQYKTIEEAISARKEAEILKMKTEMPT